MSRLLAITRDVGPDLAACELTHLERVPIDPERAARQHAAYRAALRAAGCEVLELPALPGCPDAVFVEDTAVVVAELAVLAWPGAASRRGEVESIAEALAPHRELRRVEAPGTLDGGDVLVVGRRVFVGLSSRTTREGVAQLGALLAPLGYDVRGVAVSGCLHLKSAATRVGDELLLVNPAWVDPAAFAPLPHVPVDADEPCAANALRVGERVILPAAFPRTRERLEARGSTVVPVEVDELAKAEGGVTCGSLLVAG